MKRTVSVILALCLILALGAIPAAAGSVAYLPGVTEEMTDPAYWAQRMEEPDRVLATPEEIARINAEALTTQGSNMHDLRNLPETFDGLAHCEALMTQAAEDAAYYIGWTWDETGAALDQAYFDPIIANCADPAAGENMPLRYGVAVNRAELVCFPSAHQILDDPADLDFDYQPLVGIRVNEPVAVFAASADGEYYQVYTSNCSGWVRAEDIAICRDKAEWLSAWDIPAEKRLVFWGDKLYTDYSKTAGETVCRLITMGTVLERMELTDPDGLVINRLPIHNYPVYLPVRRADGSYGKTPALINARESLSEDYLPLTGANLAKVALASLGDAYGWGGGLYNEDCTSLNRSIFTCFGLDLPRNENWQLPLAMPKILDAGGMCIEEKEALLSSLPLGTILNFPGHQMMYLGEVEGEYYVVSTVSSIMSPYSGRRQRTRDVQINSLDIRRANGRTWMQAITTMYIPWVYLPQGEESPLPAPLWYHDAVGFCLERELMDVGTDGYFLPQEAATRSAAVSALWRGAGRPEPAGETEAFPDVEPGAPYETAALWAKEQGISLGTGRGFEPDAALTRETLAVMLFRCTEVLGLYTGDRAALDGFIDGKGTADWAAEAMGWAVGIGLFRGDDEGRLNPQGIATRAELATLLQRMAGLAAVLPQADGSPQEVSAPVGQISKYGNLTLALTGSGLFARGYAWGDIVTVGIGGQEYEMPICGNYSEVDQGLPVCRVVIREEAGQDYVILAINGGDLATASGIAVKETTEEEPGYRWQYSGDSAQPPEVTIAMKEARGYYEQWVIRQLVRSNDRGDYPALTDAEFANFRMVTAGDIAQGRLYRSSSPVDPKLGRNAYADAAAARAGVRTVLNLADNGETMRGYPGFAERYYSGLVVIPLNLGVDFAAEEFRAGLAEGLRFLTRYEGPYLVHCTEGKDRAGFVCAVLECLMGAAEKEVVMDYMETYRVYYGVEPGSEQYAVIADSNIRRSLCAAFGLETLEGADLRACAEAYLSGIGLTEAEIRAVQAGLRD